MRYCKIMHRALVKVSLLATMVAVTSPLLRVAAAQTVVTVKSSPASDALSRAAQDLATEQKSFEAILEKARASMDTNQKSLQTQLEKANIDLLVELKQDKKYKDKIAAIEGLQKQIQAASQQASAAFNQQVAPIQNEIGKDKALIDGLVPVVRQENDLPSTASFDPVTQKWTVPKSVNAPVEPKK